MCSSKFDPHFEPLDITANRVVKSFLKILFQTWYSDKIIIQMNKGKRVFEVDVDTHLSKMKPTYAYWVIGLKALKFRSIDPARI